MLAKSTGTLWIGALIAMACCASGFPVSQRDYERRFNSETLEYKHARCFLAVKTYRLTTEAHNKSKDVLKKWFYYAPDKACRPLYAPANSTYRADNENWNLPDTQEECEILCGDYCVVNYPNGKIELGVCTTTLMNSTYAGDNCKDVLPETHPRQCPVKHSKCCPRNYQRLAVSLD